MATGNRIIRTTAFCRGVHLGLARIEAGLHIRTHFANACMEVTKIQRSYVTKASDLVEILIGNQGLIRTLPCKDTKVHFTTGKNKPKGDRTPRKNVTKYARFSDGETGEDVNYYDIRDPRNNVKLPGFVEGDPRTRVTSRVDATDEIDITPDGYIGHESVHKVTLRKRCLVTNKNVTVETAVDSLSGTDVLEALFYKLEKYAQYKSVVKYYTCVYQNNVILPNNVELLNLLRGQISLLARSKTLKVEQAVMLAMIYDKQGMLDPEMRYLLMSVLKEQLYAFRPYDIAATVAVYGKHGLRYAPMLNALGLVFYDLMIGGKTAVEPGGPTVDETIAVVQAYAKVKLPIKRLVDAAFGILYQHVESMSKAQMLVTLQSFFQLTKDGNYVELYTKLIAALLGEPCLYIDNFQAWAERQLATDFKTSIVGLESSIFYDKPEYTIPEVMQFMAAMSQCNSEHLIQTIHGRIEFKRLWSDNIRNKIMPWKGPTVECIEQLVGGNSGTQGPSVNAMRDVTIPDTMAESPLRTNKTMVSYRDQIPVIYNKMLKMLHDIFGPVVPPSKYLDMIYQGNKAVVDMAATLCNKIDLDMSAKLLENECQPYFPYISTLKSCIATGVPTDQLPFFKLEYSGEEYRQNSNELIDAHAQQLITHVQKLKGMKIHRQTKEIIIDNNMLSVENSLVEAVNILSLGKSTQVNDSITVVKVTENDLVHSIVALMDYSRYSDLDPTTIDVLGGLYFRLVFVTSLDGSIDTGDKDCALVNMVPRSLMLEHGHVPFTQTENTKLTPEFHRVGLAEYRFYRPHPIYEDLFRGNTDLYGLMMYTVAHKIQAIVASVTDEYLLDKSGIVTTVIQHVLHPFHVLNVARYNTVSRWHLLYYKGLLDMCHDVGYKEGIDMSQHNYDVHLHKIDATMDRAIVDTTQRIVDSVKSVQFKHVATVFVNVVLNYIRRIIDVKDIHLVGLRDWAEVSMVLSMLFSFNQVGNQDTGVITDLQSRVLAIIGAQIKEMGKSGISISRDMMAVHVEKMWHEPTGEDFYDLLNNVATKIDGHSFVAVTKALASAATYVELNEQLIGTLHTIMQLAYKRIPYADAKDIVGITMTLVDLTNALRQTQQGPEEDPRSRVTQLVGIVKSQCRQLIDSEPKTTDEAETISPLGANALLKALG
ncbi:coatomer subunit alpha, putative [Babesia ovis]|uniref:Coatomer subunit alpha, putative n=1 Tax=Babesia ovis TaxID=5869 RepID=A0A9W5TBH0_BABOV|nr:coatomer subunit alpha, putative [Babesia ovis]